MSHKVQIDDLVRDATSAEIAAFEASAAELQAHVDVLNALAAAKVSARNKLKALGLTDTEIAALVG